MTTITLKHRREFPHSNWLPSRLLATLARWGWRDESWHNDACPSFSKDGWLIWCEAKTPSLRECGGSRYTVLDEIGNDIAQFELTRDLIAWLEGS